MGAHVSVVLQMLRLLFQPQLESLPSWPFRALTACQGSNFHDTELCFWSIIIFMQVIDLSSALRCSCEHDGDKDQGSSVNCTAEF